MRAAFLAARTTTIYPRLLERRAATRVTNERLGMDIREKTWASMEFVRSYYDALEVEKDIMWLDIEKGRAASYDYLGRSPEKILDWFDRFV